jgi:hypothetical protein
MASTIILKNGTGSAVPSALAHGEPAINVNTGLFYYGSGSGGGATVKTLSNFTNITASGNISSSGDLSATGDLDIDGKSHFTGHITASGNISSSGTIITEDLQVDTITNQTTGGGIILDSAGFIGLDSAGGDIRFRDAGVNQLHFDMDGTNGAQVISPSVAGDDIIFKNQGGDSVLTLKSEGQTEIHGNITASGNISSSGNITADKIYLQNAVNPGANYLEWDGTGLHYNGSSHINGHITASGNISSSGTVIGQYAQIHGNSYIDGKLGVNAQTQPPGVFEVTGDSNFVGNITASGHISASGNISGSSIHSVQYTSATYFDSRDGTSGYKISGVSALYNSGSGDIIVGQTNQKTIITGSSVVNRKALHFLYTTNKFQLDTSVETYFSLSDADRDAATGGEDQVGVMSVVPLTGILKHVIINSSSNLSIKTWEFRLYRVPNNADADSGGAILIATVASNAGPASHANKTISFVTNTADTNVISYEIGYDAETMFTAGDRVMLSLKSNSDASGNPKINSVLCFELDENTI